MSLKDNRETMPDMKFNRKRKKNQTRSQSKLAKKDACEILEWDHTGMRKLNISASLAKHD